MVPTPRRGNRQRRTATGTAGWTSGTLRATIVLLVLVLLTVVLSAPAMAEVSRQHRFADNLDTVVMLQNMDGGFGDVETYGDAHTRTYATIRDDASVLETAATVELLLREGQDPLAIQRNWQDHKVSLAASSVPNALDWLRGMEAEHGAELGTGALAFTALTYDRLSDDANAARLVEELVRATHERERSPTAVERAQLVHVGRAIGFSSENATLNETWNRMQATVQTSADAATPIASAWALAAFPQDPAHHEVVLAAVAATLDDDGRQGSSDVRTLDKAGLALAAWSLAENGDGHSDANLTIAAVDEVYRAVPYGAARSYVMMAEVVLFPYISTTVPEVTEGAILDVGADGRRGSALEGSSGDGPAAGDDTSGRGSDGMAFPLPGWAIMLGVVLAMAAIATVSLAYGLKKEDLKGVRKQVFEYIETHPGEHFSKIRRDLGLAAGTFQHHLNVLESEGWITSFKESRYKRYFVNGNRYQTLIKGRSTEEYKGKFAALKNETSRELVRYLATNPGATQKQVAQRFNLHASTVNWHANRLKQVGILQGERVGKEVRYVVDSETVDKLLRP